VVVTEPPFVHGQEEKWVEVSMGMGAKGMDRQGKLEEKEKDRKRREKEKEKEKERTKEKGAKPKERDWVGRWNRRDISEVQKRLRELK
jgi:hypothetical protein